MVDQAGDTNPNNIFSNTAPRYWAKGLPVIPLRVGEKRPFFDDWQQWSSKMPTAAEQETWLRLYKTNNIGLPLGSQSGLVMVDYDYDNPDAETALRECLPKSQWVRVGQKGFVMAFKFNGQGGRKIFDSNGRPVVEILSTGNQVVLPPSIHPKTQMPYVATGDLAEIVDQLPMLPSDAEDLIRGALSKVISLRQKGAGGGKFKSMEFVPMGARDVQMNRYAGFLSHAIMRGEITLKAGLENMRVWFDEKMQKVEGDSIDVNKGLSQIIQYVLQDVNSKNLMLPPGWDDGLSDEEKDAWGLKFDESQEEWTFDHIIAYVRGVYDTNGNNSMARMACVQLILKKISRSEKLDTLEIDKILHALKADSGLPVSSFKKQLKELQKGAIEGISHAEIAHAVIKELNEKYSSSHG